MLKRKLSIEELQEIIHRELRTIKENINKKSSKKVVSEVYWGDENEGEIDELKNVINETYFAIKTMLDEIDEDDLHPTERTLSKIRLSLEDLKNILKDYVRRR